MELTEESANNNREHRLFGPAYSSDDAGDGPTITTTASLLIFLGQRHLNVPLKITVRKGRLYVSGIAVDGSTVCYNLKLLRYSEKGKDTLLEGDGLRIIADQTTMRRLFSKVSGRIKIERGKKRDRDFSRGKKINPKFDYSTLSHRYNQDVAYPFSPPFLYKELSKF